jgi:hypothetical protein
MAAVMLLASLDWPAMHYQAGACMGFSASCADFFRACAAGAGRRSAAFAGLSTRAPTYSPGYGVPLSAYGAAPGVVGQRRVYVEEPVRPLAPVPHGRWRGW